MTDPIIPTPLDLASKTAAEVQSTEPTGSRTDLVGPFNVTGALTQSRGQPNAVFPPRKDSMSTLRHRASDIPFPSGELLPDLRKTHSTGFQDVRQLPKYFLPAAEEEDEGEGEGEEEVGRNEVPQQRDPSTPSSEARIVVQKLRKRQPEGMILGDGSLSPSKSGSFGHTHSVNIVGNQRIPSFSGVVEHEGELREVEPSPASVRPVVDDHAVSGALCVRAPRDSANADSSVSISPWRFRAPVISSRHGRALILRSTSPSSPAPLSRLLGLRRAPSPCSLTRHRIVSARGSLIILILIRILHGCRIRCRPRRL